MAETKFIHQCKGIEYQTTFIVNQTTKEATIANTVETHTKKEILVENKTFPSLERAIENVCTQIEKQMMFTPV